MLHESHAAISRPTLLVIVTDQVLIVGVWVLGQVSLNEVSRLVLRESEYNVELINVAAVKSDGMPGLRVYIFETHEFIRSRGRTCQL